jgi:electron transport complex protein RnfG
MEKNTFKMVLILTLIAAISAVILSFVHKITKEPIEAAYRQEFIDGLKAVLPDFDNEPDRDFKEIKGNKVYLAKKDGKVFAYAMKTISEKGYSGKIVVLIGVDLKGKITGIEILQHAETPGLGDHIESTKFKDSFKGLTIEDNIKVKKDGGIIDQFSGATISPRAVSEAVRNGLKFIDENVLNQAGG